MGEERPSVPPEIHTGLLAKYALLNFLGLAIPALAGLFTLPFVLRWLGTERFGIFSWVMVVMGYFALFEFGLSRATVKYVSEALGHEEFGRIPRVLWSAVAFQAAFGLIGGAVLMLATPALIARFLIMPPDFLPEARAALTWMAVCLPINIVLPSFRGVLEAGQRFDVVNLVKIPTNSLVFIVPFLGVILRSGLKGIVIFLVLSRAFALVAWILACRRAFPGVLKVGFLPRRDLKKMFVFGGWNTLSGVVWPILISLDRILLGARLGAQAVGFYVPPGEAVNKLGMIPGSLQLTLFPAFSLLAVQPRERKAKELFAKSLKYTILVLGPLVVIIAVFAKWILHLWLGDAFARTAAPVLQILAAGYLLQSLTYVPFSYLQGLGRADVTSIIQTVELVVIFPVFLLFIRWWGIAGAAAGVGFRSAFELVFLLSASWKRGGFDGAALAEEKAVVLVAALGGLAVWSMAWRRITDGLPGFFAVAAALVVYAVFSWARVLDSEERGRLRKLISAKQLS